MQPQSRSPYGGPSALTPVVQGLLISNGVIFVLGELFDARYLQVLFALWPVGTNFFPWQLLTYGFLHGSVSHLFFNLFAVWMFGSSLEKLWGSTRFLIYFLVCVVGAGVIQLLVIYFELMSVRGGPTVGASGGVFGILLAYGMMYPNRMILLIFPPIPMRAKYLVVLFGLFELWLGVSGRQTGVAHFAHLGGMFFGFFLIRYWRGQLPFQPRR